MKGMEFNRRQFIKVSLVAGTGLLVACHASSGSASARRRSDRDAGFVPNAWIRIAPDDTVTVIVKHTELGQGTSTGLCMIVAEELEADWSKIRFEIAPVAPVYKNPEFKVQATGGSTGVKTSWETLRRAGAATREMLVSAAAATWNVPPSECRAEKSTVVHGPSRNRVRYGELLQRAASIPAPEDPRLKSPEEFRIIGRPYSRLDTGDKAKGRTVYGLDFKMEGLLTAAVAHAPMIGGIPASVEDGETRSMPGVRDVVVMDAGVAVVAETFWQAQTGIHALKIEWKGGDPSLSSETIMSRFAGKIREKGIRVRDDGRVEQAMENAVRRIRAVYELPYQAHACPEPMNCTAQVLPDRCEIWAPTQNQEAARDIAARITGLPLSAVRVHTPFVGGGFGGRSIQDFVAEAVTLSKTVSAPVKVIWSREEDMRNDYYRPAFYNLMEAGLDREGFPVAWIHKAVGQSKMDKMIESSAPSILPQWLPSFIRYAAAGVITPIGRRFIGPKGAMSGSADMAYGIEHVRVEYVRADLPVRVGTWRSVADSRNGFVKESFMDEIAAASGKDPVELRARLLRNIPKHRTVLETAAAKAGWGKRLPEGIFRGVALHAFHGTPAAMVAEVSVEKGGRVRVHRVVCAVDCGIAVNPKMVEAQIAGGVVFGLTATLRSSLRIKEGRVMESNFHDFPILRMNETPKVEVHIIKSTSPPTGIGEVGVPPIGPAVTNALFQATGKRIRTLPVDPAELTG
ncbi:MAG: xanthine dehydrogenase family protein molybdopterin-binding subunit [Desulfobacteraceae bacterium]|nr:MAG: xanthine dehydrogenase family protein molybdopterin-binding subunit [Desulfobacteraceae bacterium]